MSGLKRHVGIPNSKGHGRLLISHMVRMAEENSPKNKLAKSNMYAANLLAS